MRTVSLKKLLVVFLITATTQVCGQPEEVELLQSINQHGSSFKTSLANTVSTSTIVFGVAEPAAFLVPGLIKNDPLLKQHALYMAGASAFNYITTEVLKRTIRRDRPFETYSFIIKRNSVSRDVSFPSGHSSSAFCTATNLALRYPKWYVIVPSYMWASSVAWSRMYQGIHYPSDVFAGALIGAGSAWLGYKLQKRMQRKKELKNVSELIWK